MGRRTRIGALGAGALLGVVAGLVPVTAPVAAQVEALARSTVATPAGALTTTTIAVGAPPGTRARAGAAIEVPVDPGTQMAGVSWTGGGPVDVEVAAPEGDGWGPWVPLHAEDAPDPRAGGRTGVGPVWLGGEGVDRVALRIAGAVPADLRIDAMQVAASPRARPVTYDRPATPAGGPTIVTRASWAPGGWQGGRAGCTATPTASTALRFAVVHHTAGSNSYTAAQVPSILAGIYRFHTATNGWCDVAYNVFVDRFGTVWEGRTGGLNAPIMGGHAKGFNTDSVGVALIGTYDGAPTGASMSALRDVLAWKLGSHGIDPRTSTPIVSKGSTRYPAGRRVVLPTVQGHRDSGLTACPGGAAYARLPALRNDVAGRIAATNASGTWAPSTTGAAFFGRLDDAALGRRATNGRAGFYTSLVTRGGYPRNPLATSIVLSTATETRIAGPDRLYRAAFGREADTGGLRFWVGRRDAGMTMTEMARRFSGTPEFRTAYAGLDDEAFVTTIYANVLRRAPDADGFAFWVDQLDDGRPRFRVLAQFSESAEHKRLTRIPGLITRAYFVMLHRNASSTERSTWTGALSSGTSGDDMVAMLLASAEYRAGA